MMENPENQDVHPKRRKLPVHTCVQCGEDFTTVFRLDAHKKLKNHSNNCPRCPEVKFSSWPDYKDHLKEIHNGMTLHACKHCSQAFEDPDDMRVHISQNHQHQCSECGKMFLNVGGLNTR